MSDARTMLIDREKVAEALASLPRPGALDEAIVMTVAEWYADGRLVLAAPPAAPLDVCPDCGLTAQRIGEIHITAQRARLSDSKESNDD